MPFFTILRAEVVQTRPVVGETTPDEMARRHFELAEGYYSQRDYDNALAHFNEAYRLSNKPAILYNIGMCHDLLGDREKALENFEQFLKAFSPDYPQRKEVEETVAKLKAGLEEEKRKGQGGPDAPGSEESRRLYQEGMEAVEKGDCQLALNKFELVVGLDPSLSRFSQIGLCYEKLGLTQKAIEAYQNYLNLGSPTPEQRKEIESKVARLKAPAAEKPAAPKPPARGTPLPTVVLPPVPFKPKPTFRIWKWVAFGAGGAALAAAVLSYKKAADKDQRHAHRIDELFDQNQIEEVGGRYRFASEEAKRRYGSELNGMAEDVQTYQGLAIGAGIVGGLLAGAGAALWIYDSHKSRSEASVGFKGTQAAQLKFQLRF